MNTDLKNIKPELRDLIIQITTNNLGVGQLELLQLTDTSKSNQIFLVRLIFHMAVMLSCAKYHKLFSPIALIYEQPLTLQDKFFPTMMDDNVFSAKVAMTEGGKWYRCPNGHPYFIGDVCYR